MEVGQGPNWGCSANEKKKDTFLVQVYKFTLGVKLFCLGTQNNTKIFPQAKKKKTNK
jgi:hypothetical protein